MRTSDEPAAEHGRDVDAATDGHVGAHGAHHPADGEHLPGGHRQDGVCRDRAPIQRDLGLAHHGGVRGAGETQGWSGGCDLDPGGFVDVAHQAVGRPKCERVGGPRPGHAEARHPDAASVLDEGQEAGILDDQGRRRGADQWSARPAAGEGAGVVDGPQPHAVADAEGGEGRGVGVEQGHPGAPDDVPAAGRRLRVDPGETPGQGEGPGGHRGAGGRPPADGGERSREPGEVGEAGEEPQERDGQHGVGQELGHCVGRDPRQSRHLPEVGTVEGHRDLDRPGNGRVGAPLDGGRRQEGELPGQGRHVAGHRVGHHGQRALAHDDVLDARPRPIRHRRAQGVGGGRGVERDDQSAVAEPLHHAGPGHGPPR